MLTTDQQVLSAASLQGASPIETTAVLNIVAGPVDSLPPGTVDHAARAAVVDLDALIVSALRAYAAGEGDLTALTTEMSARLSPDPVALSQALQKVWDRSVEIATELSDTAMRGSSWSDSAGLAVGMAPFALLCPAVSLVAGPLLAKFSGALPPITAYPSELEPVIDGMEAFRDGIYEGLIAAKLLEPAAYLEILDKFTTSMQEHVIIANTVLQAGMIVGVIEQIISDAIGIAALIVLLGSGPILVAVLGYAAYSLWQAGATQVAHDFGRALADMAAEPFGKLREAGTGVDFLFEVGRTSGPVVLSAMLFMTGITSLGIVASTSARIAKLAMLAEKLKRILATSKKAEPLHKAAEKLPGVYLDLMRVIAEDIGGEAPAQFERFMQKKHATAFLEDIVSFLLDELEDMDEWVATVQKLLSVLDGYTERQFEGLQLLAKHPPHSNSRKGGPDFGNFGWVDLVIEEGAEKAVALLADRLGVIAGRVDPSDTGLAEVITDFFYRGGKTTGACGVLFAAADMLDKHPGSTLKFEVAEVRRIIDCVVYRAAGYLPDGKLIERLVLEVEVKTFPSGRALEPEHAEQMLTQIRKDLVRHATEGDPELANLVWLMDPTGYADVGEQVKGLFRLALELEENNLVGRGVNYSQLSDTLKDLLNQDIILNFFQTGEPA